MAKNKEWIEHRLLGVEATKEEIAQLCQEAIDNNFSRISINSNQVRWAKKFLISSSIKISAIIGFPSGLQDTGTKLYEAQEALNSGANEIDLIVNIKAFKDGDYGYVAQELVDMRKLTRNHVFKVIIDTSLLGDEEILTAVQLATEANADFIRTIAGFRTKNDEELMSDDTTIDRLGDGPGILIMQTTPEKKKK